jgi:hypothetical protein
MRRRRLPIVIVPAPPLISWLLDQLTASVAVAPVGDGHNCFLRGYFRIFTAALVARPST